MNRNLRRYAGRLALVVAALSLIAPVGHAQATITVDSTAQEVTLANPTGIVNGNCTLGEAMIAANSNAAVDACVAGQAGGTDTIVIPAGAYTLTVVGGNNGLFNSPIGLPPITEALTLQGAAAATTIIERSTAGGTPDFAMTFNTGVAVTFQGLTIRGFASPPTGISGSIMFYLGPTAVNDCIVENNFTNGTGSADRGGGFSTSFNSNAPFSANNTLFRNNSATNISAGVILFASGPVTLTNSTFENHSVTTASSVLYFGGDGPFTISNSVFRNNLTDGPGTVIRMATLPNCGPACGVNPVVTIARSYFHTNSTPPNGSSGSSGGVLTTSGQNLTMTITESTFSDNVAASNIGGVFNLDGNTGTVTIENSTFSGNRAATFGTAIYANGNPLALTLNNVTISDNFGTAFLDGAALFLSNGATATLRNTVIARNTINGSVCDVRTSGGGNFISQGNNMFGHTACATFSVTDPSDQMWSQQWPFHPVLIPLADNGGPQAGANIGGVTPVTIPTRGLFTGSPLIDLGSALAPGSGGTACLATDQRGQARPGGARCDIGAFEDATAAGVIAVFDLAVTKTDTPDPVNVGQDITYTITVTNNGADPAPNVVVTDPLPVGATFVSAVAENDPFGTCAFAAGTVTCNIGTIAQGDSLDVTIVITVNGSASSPLINTATATATGTEANNADNSGTASTTVNGVGADLSITKTDSPDPIVLGAGDITYTITIANAGPQNATNVVLTDNLPAGFTLASSTLSQGTCQPPVGPVVTCNLGTINNGANATVTLQVTPTAAGNATNVASVAATESDPTPANNSASASTTVNAQADLSVTKTDAPDPITLGGGNITYTVTVANAGPSPATSVVLTDTLPAGVTFVSATAPCTQAAGTVTCNLGTLASGTNVVVTIVITPTVAGTLNNSAAVASAVTDPNAANNNATANTTVNPSADLSVTVADAPDPITLGTGNITYTLNVTNAGPSPATSVTLTDTLPAGVMFVSATAPCMQAAGTVTCNLGTLAIGANTVLSIVITPTAAGTLNNSATVANAVTDPNAANNTAAAATTVNSVADLSVAVADAPDPITLGSGDITYTVTVANAGPSPATGVTLTNTLPAGTAFVSATAPCTQAAGTVSCNLGILASGANTVLTIVITPTAAGTVNNGATVASAVADLNAANDSAAAATTVIPSANLSVSLTDAPDPVTAGANITYSATVGNAGPSAATGVVFTMAVPANTTFVSANASAGTCTQAAGTVACNIGTMNSGANVTATIVVTATAAGTVNASGSVTSAVGDPSAANNAAAASTTVNAGTGTGFTVASSTASQTVFASQSAAFNINVMPTGGSYSNVVNLTATGLPSGATFNFNPASVTPGATGAPSVLTISVPFRAQAPPGTLFVWRLPLWFASALALVLALLGIAATLRRAGFRAARPLRAAALVLLVILLSGGTLACATADGGFPLSNLRGTYTVTITGTSGAIQQSTTVTLTVQ